EVGIIEGLTIAAVPRYANNNHWMNLLQIDSKAYGSEWEALMARLEENGIQTRPVWALIHLQKPYRDCQSYKVERGKELVNNNLCLPSSTSLRDDQIHKVMDSMHG
ncbi:MAG: DegT/DnrJ/EryC1/StrS family aminotransferase, partial [Candidatus Poribacteria bacterium]|nr:DegT/DnrJ/EryC1/StrS family aminotransferase [Candidatus Poribacteria bacterium]